MSDRIVAGRLRTQLDTEGLPDISAWENSPIAAFCSDWRNQNPDPGRETEVQLLWSPDQLFVRFHCRYRDIFVYEGGNARRDQLWQRDVAEVFIRPPAAEEIHYKEFEISPNGDWLDLDIEPDKKTVLLCDLRTRVFVDEQSRIWIAELGIPMRCLTGSFDPGETWRVNFFRIEGREPERFYSAWRPTYTPRPNFHIPSYFGRLDFVVGPAEEQ